MRAKLVNENLNVMSIEDILRSIVRTKKTLEKYLDYLKRIDEFSEENLTIDKKELTRISNDLDGAFAKTFEGKDERGYRAELEGLAKESGWSSVYNAAEKGDKLFRTLQFFMAYGISDAKRKVEELGKLDISSTVENFVNKYYPNINQWANLSYKLDEIRSILNPTKEQREAKELKRIKGSMNPLIKSTIDEIAENFRLYIEEKEYSRYIRRIKDFNLNFPEGIFYNDIHSRKNQQYKSIGRFLVKKSNKLTYNPNEVYVIIPEYEKLAKKMSYDTSVSIISSWQFKMYDKLGGFISELNKKFTILLDGETMNDNFITFNFEDGSRFSIQNQIVAKVSNLGTYFYTYPTTFHNAFLPNGEKIANPNEFTVKNAFNNFKN